MKRSFRFRLLAVTLAFAHSTAFSAEPPPKIFRDRVEPHWFADAQGSTNLFWYRVELPRGECKFILVDAASGERRRAFDHARVAKAWGGPTGKPVLGESLPIDALDFASDQKSVVLRGSGKPGGWIWKRIRSTRPG